MSLYYTKWNLVVFRLISTLCVELLNNATGFHKPKSKSHVFIYGFPKTRNSTNGNDGSSSFRINSGSIVTITSNMLYSSTYVVKVQTTYKQDLLEQ